MDSFARDRVGQGVPVYAQGPISTINLRPPSAAEVQVLVKGHVGRLLDKLPQKDGLGECFPFADEFMRKEASDSQNLRITLTRLRDEYSRCVYGQENLPIPPVKEPVVPSWETLLESTWNEHHSAASRKMQGSMAGYRSSIHAGLGSMLEHARPLELAGWNLTEVHQSISIGDNPTYGVASLLHWQHQQQSTDKNGAVLRMGVAFLLAPGTGMAHDLRAKFDFFRRPAKGEQLLILWPAPRDGDDLVELLPRTTRTAWDENRHSKKTTLVRVDQNDLQSLLCFSDWLNSLADRGVPNEQLRAFVEKRFQSLLQLVAPPVPKEERTSADED